MALFPKIHPKLRIKAVLLLLFSFQSCDCDFNPCNIPEVAVYNYLIFSAMFPRPPEFSGSCSLQNDCIEYQATTSEVDHQNLCEVQGGTFDAGGTCDQTGKLFACSVLEDGPALRVKLYYGSTWTESDSTQHCLNVLAGKYSTL